ncbi:DNA alkylation repair protein, partial [Candidatus Microgenomates bacterium]|nr:DNA alkylation repair protein [Candidatus Microgenomates bacterium]
MSKDIQTTVEEFLKVLKKSADEKYRKGSVVSTPSSLRKLGVSVPIKRKIAREWLEENREMIEVDFLTLLNTLLQQPISEMRGLALELL